MAAVPVTRTWVAGEVVTAPHFNDNIRDVLLYLLARPLAVLRNTVSQTVSSATWASLLMNTEDADTAGGHSTSSNTSRYTAVYPGWYRHSGLYSPAANATGRRGTRWAVNGTAVASSQAMVQATSASETSVTAITKLIFLAVNDYSELQAFQESGGSLGTKTTSEQQNGSSIIWESN